jgi:hypothetical protein
MKNIFVLVQALVLGSLMTADVVLWKDEGDQLVHALLVKWGIWFSLDAWKHQHSLVYMSFAQVCLQRMCIPWLAPPPLPCSPSIDSDKLFFQPSLFSGFTRFSKQQPNPASGIFLLLESPSSKVSFFLVCKSAWKMGAFNGVPKDFKLYQLPHPLRRGIHAIDLFCWWRRRRRRVTEWVACS